MEFFRHCPGCGRRFHIKLESKKLVGVEREEIPAVTMPRTTVNPFREPSILLVREGPPIHFALEEFQYTYKCHHCGHEWSEKHGEEHRER